MTYSEESFNRLEQRLGSIEQRLEEGFSRPASRVLDEVLGLEQRTNERLDRLAESQQALQAEVRQLIGAIFQISRDAEADRAVIREMQVEIREMQTEVRGLQSENRRILDHLFGQPPG